MLKEYIKIAWRCLFRNSLVSFINIFGLALSMSICLLVLMRVKDRLDYDRFHPREDRMFRVITQLTNKEGQDYRFASTPMALAEKLSKDYNITESIDRLYVPGSKRVTVGKKEMNLQTALTEPAFFKVFGFTLGQGNEQTALLDPNGVVLTRAAAMKYFGREDVLGQTMRFENWGDFRVTGVLRDPEGKSHIDFEGYLSMSSLPQLAKAPKSGVSNEPWNATLGVYTYLRLRNGVTRQQLDRAITQEANDVMKNAKTAGRERISFEAQSFRSIMLGEELLNSMGDTGSRGKVLSEVVIAFIILLMACFNYTNLSIARSLKRGKEIGIRKLAGAVRGQVFVQFVLESVMTALFALVLAYVMLKLIMDYAPFASEMVPAGATISVSLVGWFVLFSLFTGLLAGVLPSWALSSFKPVDVLKNLTTVTLFGGNGFRKSLTVAQFSLSLFIIVFTMIFSRQFNYISTADPGFRRENMLNISLNGADAGLMAARISKLPGVAEISASSVLPGKQGANRCMVKTAPGSEPITFDCSDIDTGFITNSGMRLLAGSGFTMTGSGLREQYVIINETALSLLKAKRPLDALGKPMWIEDSIPVQVVGVVKDFSSRGLDMPVAPLVFRNRADAFKFLNVRVYQYPNKPLVAGIEKIWKADNPGAPLEYSWLQEDLNRRESAWSTVSMLGFLAFIAVTISCLGLLGMVIYTTERRRKEIGIRKVMGASVHAIVMLLSKSVLKLVVIAGAIALPLSYVAGWLFLQMFANRISIGPGILLGGFVGLMGMVLLTIGVRIFKVASSNPVNSLRTE